MYCHGYTDKIYSAIVKSLNVVATLHYNLQVAMV